MTRMIVQSTLTFGGVSLNTPPIPNPPRRVTLGPPPEFINVVCVWWGDLYGIQYVEKLRNMVARHLPIPHRFHCITPHSKVPEGVIHVAPPLQSPGSWWQKVNLFHEDLFPRYSRVLYFDLDVVVVKSLFDLARAVDPFCMIENYGPNKAHAAHNSSVMLWTPDAQTKLIYERFTPEVMQHLHGDQCWIWRVMLGGISNFRQDTAVSYKYEKAKVREWSHKSEDTSVVVFHGRPKPHEVRDPEILTNWV